MICRFRNCTLLCLFVMVLAATSAFAQATWTGVLTDSEGKPVYQAFIFLASRAGGQDHEVTTVPDGAFALKDLAAGSYTLEVMIGEKHWKAPSPIFVKDASAMIMNLRLGTPGNCWLQFPLSKFRSRQAVVSAFPALKFRACRSTFATSANCCCSRPAP